MTLLNRARTVLAAALLLAAAGPALADRAPTLNERALIERALRVQGFVSWGDIDLDEGEGVWDVEDALSVDGREYELKLRARTLEVIEREES